ncbi:MAG TPA: tRNA (guanosine(46)-N7)-methyltransferase TrmB [Gammaproteobacteria bacterium]|nr:tRNA (guanosine(46)-N7)-methyltransferase TrmB [Gammaproteobacteria bacterium]HRA42671.1 tRNA (guanosine(46)-N7)-methyltransferase TrmB [Gammaproteobacteria bacterium]
MQVVSPYPLRPIRSFVRREGRISKAQLSAWERLWPIYGLSASDPGCIAFESLFGRTADTVLEIGFGDGHSLAEMAKNAPEKNFIGIEVYRTGVGNLLTLIEKHKLSNIRIFCADAVEILTNKIPDNSLTTLQLFFADPWPKVRHHKRRIVQASFIKLVSQKLKSLGTFHLATDWMDYAYHMMAVLGESVDFVNASGANQFTPRPDFRPVTKYEQRGLRLGHQTWDLIFLNRD